MTTKAKILLAFSVALNIVLSYNVYDLSSDLDIIDLGDYEYFDPPGTEFLSVQISRARAREVGAFVSYPQTFEEWSATCKALLDGRENVEGDNLEGIVPLEEGCTFFRKHGPPISELEYFRACRLRNFKPLDCKFLKSHVPTKEGYRYGQ